MLHIEEISNDKILNTYHTSFYQVTYEITDSFFIAVSQKYNAQCKFITYSYDNSITGRTTLLEGIEQQFQFTKDIEHFILLYPFYYSHTKDKD